VAARAFALGRWTGLDGAAAPAPLHLPPHHLVTHAAVVGMTGSGKTGLVFVLVEEALRSGIPVLAIDPKGDLPNLLLAFPLGAAEPFLPWVAPHAPAHHGQAPEAVAAGLAAERDAGLAKAGLGPAEIEAYRARLAVRVLTPGSTAGEPVHLLSSLERRSPLWDSDLESARAALSSALSLVLRLVGRDPEPTRSKDHVLLAVLAERRLRAGGTADLASLIADLDAPPIETVGALDVDDFLSKSGRRELAAALNALLASPSVATWREGASLDVGAWLAPQDGRTPAVVLSVAHLDEDDRALVLGLVLEEVLAWVRGLPGTSSLRALVVFDEVYGFLPPHPATPPTKRPLVALLKQARAYGVGLLVATQNPMDLDYRALSNAGLWFVGRLQTDADRARVVEGMAEAGADRDGGTRAALSATIKKLAKRWFVVRDAHGKAGAFLLNPRHAISWMRGPLTRAELRVARAGGPG
jgi:DNA helicase HerA-like ATPase